MRVALFTDTFEPHMNGVARTLGRWRDAMGARGHETRIFTTSAQGAHESDAVRRAPSVPFWAYNELRLSAPHWPRARRELEQFAPDVVHAATPFGVGLVGRAAARSMRVPLVTSYHTSLVQYARFYGLGLIAEPGLAYLRWFHNSGRRTFVPTQAIARELEQDGFRGVSLWTRGVDTARFHPGYRDPSLREAMGASHNTTLVAYVGRVAAEKGVDVAARAMVMVKERRSQVLFAVAGDGPCEPQCRKLAPQPSWFAGRLSGQPLSAFYASADIFVFPSTTDTFGNVLLEAMASGLAVVAADVPQSREVVGPDAGVFAKPGDPAAFADAITALIDDRERLDAMRRAALIRARSQGWDAIFDRLVNDYRAALSPESGAT
jgi:glycosyltransferase involved in cell wall biosynthesis